MQINWGFLLIGVALAIYGLYRLVKLYLRYRKVYASRHWPEASATVTNRGVVGVKANYSRGNPAAKHYFTEVSYSYAVAGINYHGKFQIDTLSGSPDSAAKKRDKYPVGATLSVHYNPKKPKEYISQYDRRNINNLLTVWAVIILLGLALAIIPQFVAF